MQPTIYTNQPLLVYIVDHVLYVCVGILHEQSIDYLSTKNRD